MAEFGRDGQGEYASFYDVLQIVPWCDQEVVHAAYRALARRWHPDLNRGPEAESQMRLLNAAYHVLGDPKQRASYDRDIEYQARLAARREQQPARSPTTADPAPAPVQGPWFDPPRAAWAAPSHGPAFRSARPPTMATTLPRGARPAAYIAVVMLSAIVTIVIWLAVDTLFDGQLNGIRIRSIGNDASASGQLSGERFPSFAPSTWRSSGPTLSDSPGRLNR